MNKTIRQGDVLLQKIEKLPKGLKRKDKIIAYGEITGHTHRFESEAITVFEDKNKQQYIEANKPAKLLHQEHAPLEVEQGVYKVFQQREYDILEDEVRQVLD